MNIKRPSRLEKQPASSIARRMIHDRGVEGSALTFAELSAGQLELVYDCKGDRYDTSVFQQDDLELIGAYLEKQRKRVADFLGVDG